VTLAAAPSRILFAGIAPISVLPFILAQIVGTVIACAVVRVLWPAGSGPGQEDVVVPQEPDEAACLTRLVRPRSKTNAGVVPVPRITRHALQMAEGLLRAIGAPASKCSRPATENHPVCGRRRFVAMAEVGIDISGQRSKTLEQFP